MQLNEVSILKINVEIKTDKNVKLIKTTQSQ